MGDREGGYNRSGDTRENQGGDYIEQSLPTGANTIGLNSQGKMVCNGWYFSIRGRRWEKGRGDTIGLVIQMTKYVFMKERVP